MSDNFREAVMTCSRLLNKFWKNETNENQCAHLKKNKLLCRIAQKSKKDPIKKPFFKKRSKN